MSAPAAGIAELEFLTKLQRILNEGLFTASYKYALLVALAELSVEKSIAPLILRLIAAPDDRARLTDHLTVT